MANDLKSRIDDEVKAAMRARDRERLGILRQITAAIKQREIDGRTTLDEAGVLATLDHMRKQRRDSLEQFEKASRDDLAQQEAYEITVLEEFMPAALGEAEIEQLIAAAIESLGASSMADMGKVMGRLKGELQGRADLGAVSASVRKRLSG